jgi:hypothetical protein
VHNNGSSDNKFLSIHLSFYLSLSTHHSHVPEKSIRQLYAEASFNSKLNTGANFALMRFTLDFCLGGQCSYGSRKAKGMAQLAPSFLKS